MAYIVIFNATRVIDDRFGPRASLALDEARKVAVTGVEVVVFFDVDEDQR